MVANQTPNRTNPGEAFNDFVAALERALSSHESALVEVRKRLRDRDTGRLREHDVVITWRQQHHTIVTAIECRDRGRKVGVPDVEGFADKCEHTGVHHGVIVSASGFRDTARKKAAARGISLLELTEAASFDWMGIEFFVGFERKFGPVNAHVFFKEEKPEGTFTLFDRAGTEIDAERLTHTFIHHVPEEEDPLSAVGKTRDITMQMNTVDWTAKDASGREFTVDHIMAHASMVLVKHVHPVTTHSYSGGGKDYQIVSGPVAIGAAKGTLMLVEDDQQIRVIWHTADGPTT